MLPQPERAKAIRSLGVVRNGPMENSNRRPTISDNRLFTKESVDCVAENQNSISERPLGTTRWLAQVSCSKCEYAAVPLIQLSREGQFDVVVEESEKGLEGPRKPIYNG